MTNEFKQDVQLNYFKDSNFKRILIIFIIGLSFAIIMAFLYGESFNRIYYRSFDWITSFVFAILIDKICLLLKRHSDSISLNILPYLLLISPLIYSMEFLFRNSFEYNEMFYFTAYFVNCSFQIIVALSLFQQLNYTGIFKKPNGSNYQKEELNELTGKHSETTKNPILEDVISSIQQRINSSSKVISFSLVSLIVIVIVGGVASFGTVALDDATKVRELEVERLKMLKIVNTLKYSKYEKSEDLIKNVKSIINDNYGTESSYRDILDKVEKQSYISWPDIAMRITIAALTLFLVQIFFHIYKYNQQQVNYLLNKSETIKLYRETGSNQEELRSSLLAKVDSNPKFEKSPPTPTEQFINIIGHNKDAK